MGCDIHMYAEKRVRDDWLKVTHIFNDPYYRAEDGPTGFNEKFTDRPYKVRNYDLFAILANVRNGRGFAGCDTGDGFIPISMPRGLPTDVSWEVREESDKWGADGHSHSYFTLKELLDYDGWEQTTKQRGIVSEAYYKTDYVKGETPESFCGGVSGNDVVVLMAEEYDKLTHADYDANKKYYVRVEWVETYSQAAGNAFFDMLEELKKVGEPADVRIVFWFDN